MTLKIGDRTLDPGERRTFLAPLGCRPDGSPQGVPLMAIMGAQAGPVLGITTGIHGDEYEGPAAVRELMQELDPSTLKGGIICTPQANVTAFEIASRTGWVDQLDLNRQFPGKPDGFVSQRIAGVLVREIVEQADAIMDLHSAGLAYELQPYVGFNSTPGPLGDASFALAKAVGVPVLYGSTPFPNVLRLEAAARNLPAILVEIGGEGRCRPDKVALMKRGVLNVLRHLGILPGEPEALPRSYTVVQAPPTGEFSHMPTGGFLLNRAELGSRVKTGDLLGTIVDVYGQELDRIDAWLDGLVLSFRTIPASRTGDWAYSLVNVLGESRADTPLSAVIGG